MLHNQNNLWVKQTGGISSLIRCAPKFNSQVGGGGGGVGGATIPELVENGLFGKLAEHRPQLLIFEVGINDITEHELNTLWICKIKVIGSVSMMLIGEGPTPLNYQMT